MRKVFDICPRGNNHVPWTVRSGAKTALIVKGVRKGCQKRLPEKGIFERYIVMGAA